MSETEPRQIRVVHHPEQAELDRRGVFLWDVWSKDPSCFPWTYSEKEVCYLLEGEAIVTPEGGEPVPISAGDFVEFPKGLTCTWDVKQHVRKHYAIE